MGTGKKTPGGPGRVSVQPDPQISTARSGSSRSCARVRLWVGMVVTCERCRLSIVHRCDPCVRGPGVSYILSVFGYKDTISSPERNADRGPCSNPMIHLRIRPALPVRCILLLLELVNLCVRLGELSSELAHLVGAIPDIGGRGAVRKGALRALLERGEGGAHAQLCFLILESKLGAQVDRPNLQQCSSIHLFGCKVGSTITHTRFKKPRLHILLRPQMRRQWLLLVALLETMRRWRYCHYHVRGHAAVRWRNMPVVRVFCIPLVARVDQHAVPARTGSEWSECVDGAPQVSRPPSLSTTCIESTVGPVKQNFSTSHSALPLPDCVENKATVRYRSSFHIN